MGTDHRGVDTVNKHIPSVLMVRNCVGENEWYMLTTLSSSDTCESCTMQYDYNVLYKETYGDSDDMSVFQLGGYELDEHTEGGKPVDQDTEEAQREERCHPHDRCSECRCGVPCRGEKL